jgi:hypothetical protein
VRTKDRREVFVDPIRAARPARCFRPAYCDRVVHQINLPPAQLARRACHDGGHWGRFGAVHHESDGPSIGSDGATVHPGRELVPGEQRGEVGIVTDPRPCAQAG